MRIAFTHNLQLSECEDEAEFDRPETVTAIAESLRRLGHEVEPVEVSGPASRVVARLEALSPDLIFNTAEGTRGRFREAFFPALFERLGFPFTGSDAYVCALTLDKHLTKRVLADHGVPTPAWRFVDSVADLIDHGLRFPLMVKPNFEGSSIGITADSVVADDDTLRLRAADLLARFPAGVLVEEFIGGRDLVVPWVEKASPADGGVLEPALYDYDPAWAAGKQHVFYDLELKTTAVDKLHVRVPAGLPAEVRERAMEISRRIFRVLGLRDVARNDFRLDDRGELYFLEINALPSLEAGSSLYLSGALVGLGGMDGVLDCIVRSAADRFGVQLSRLKRRRGAPLRFGLAFNDPAEASALAAAIGSYGHDVVELEATPELPALVAASGVDLVFNVADGRKTRNRAAQVPALLELVDIDYTGSDSSALSLALDRALARRILAQAGVPIVPFAAATAREADRLGYPLAVRPGAGSEDDPLLALVADEAGLRAAIDGATPAERPDLLVEPAAGGRDLLVGLIGERRPRVLPIFELIDPIGERRLAPAALEEPARREAGRVARSAFTILRCRDVCLVWLRAEDERIAFLAAHPLPSLAPDAALRRMAEAAGMDFRTLIGEIMAPAIRRLRERRRVGLLARP